MTRRGDRETSERRSGIGEDERQPVIAQLEARRRRSNLVIMATLRKETFGLSISEKGSMKSFLQERKELLREASRGSRDAA